MLVNVSISESLVEFRQSIFVMSLVHVTVPDLDLVFSQGLGSDTERIQREFGGGGRVESKEGARLRSRFRSKSNSMPITETKRTI
jgi:hypothetical protein